MKPLKVNIKYAGKPTSTTININIAARFFLIKKLYKDEYKNGHEGVAMYLQAVQVEAQRFANLLNTQFPHLNKDVIEQYMLDFIVWTATSGLDIAEKRIADLFPDKKGQTSEAM